MPCFDSSAILGAILSLVGSVLLVIPALKASVLLRDSVKLSQTASPQGQAGEPSGGQKTSPIDTGIQMTAKAIERDAREWTPLNHWLLIAGIVSVVAGGTISLIDALCTK
ncbi:DNA/RNA helicases [Thiohalobacter thiocyanaticus]|uniref:DNA/RNA helicases n=1 Tax=Thiohalobacter thiocyanaticus TaxID=585455 RepID=A0A1Z4VQ61_9GAMM|nr:hypothetical protein [Thiohalobacter thiocyanaticus]BAZ93776.1 DNA/RNA helicases [Thiohalobacter thiocyanaticus]